MKIRRLKIGYQPKTQSGYVLNIRLAGEWLRQAGIEISHNVEVRVYEGRIEIIQNGEM